MELPALREFSIMDGGQLKLQLCTIVYNCLQKTGTKMSKNLKLAIQNC